jgi:hypothetical protein
MKTVEPARGANPILDYVDWGKFVSVLGDAGYKGPVVPRLKKNLVAECRRSLRHSIACLRQFVT